MTNEKKKMKGNNFLLIAEIISLYGKNGFLRIELKRKIGKIIENFNEVFIDFFGKLKQFSVEEIKEIKNGFIIKFYNFSSEEECLLLTGRKIFVDSAKFPELKNVIENSFSYEDLIGCNVFRNGDKIGIVNGFFNLPSNDVLEITNKNGEEILIPFIEEFIETFNPDENKLILKPGDELFYDEN